MKRILFVGDLRGHTRTAQRMRAFARLGHHVTGVSTVELNEEAPRGATLPLLRRLRHRLGVPQDGTAANATLIELAQAQRFDVLWVEKAQPIRPATLRSVLREQPALRCALFAEDDMLLRSNRTSWFEATLGCYDIVFTTKSYNADPEELPRMGARRVLFVPKTFDPDLHKPREVDATSAAELGSTVGFVGTFESERATQMLALARAGIEVRIWGNGWERWRDRHPRLLVEGRPVYGERYVETVCSTDINLGFLRRATRDLHTDRSVEIPACGAFLLAERTPEHEQLFTEGSEAEYFGDRLELHAKILRYAADAVARERIAAGGRARCLGSDYSHDSALINMLRVLQESARRPA